MFSFRHSVVSLSLTVLIALASTTAASDLPDACASPRGLLEQDRARSTEGRPGEVHCYRLDIVDSAWLYLNLSVAGSATSGARFDLLPTASGRFGRNADEIWGLVEPGTYFLTVRAEDPHQPLPAYRLTTEHLELDHQAEKGENDGEIEIEPEELAWPGSCGQVEKGENDGEIEIEPEEIVAPAFPDKGENDGEIEIEPEELTAPQCGRPRRLVERLCGAGERDDHDDRLLCATPLIGKASGEIANGWGDDADVFGFRIHQWQTVVLSTAGGVDTRGTLLDAHGMVLEANDDGGESGNFRVVRTLAPGTYFVRVQGVGSTGNYSLSLEALAD